jgi:hypothetical protein
VTAMVSAVAFGVTRRAGRRRGDRAGASRRGRRSRAVVRERGPGEDGDDPARDRKRPRADWKRRHD